MNNSNKRWNFSNISDLETFVEIQGVKDIEPNYLAAQISRVKGAISFAEREIDRLQNLVDLGELDCLETLEKFQKNKEIYERTLQTFEKIREKQAAEGMFATEESTERALKSAEKRSEQRARKNQKSRERRAVLKAAGVPPMSRNYNADEKAAKKAAREAFYNVSGAYRMVRAAKTPEEKAAMLEKYEEAKRASREPWKQALAYEYGVVGTLVSAEQVAAKAEAQRQKIEALKKTGRKVQERELVVLEMLEERLAAKTAQPAQEPEQSHEPASEPEETQETEEPASEPAEETNETQETEEPEQSHEPASEPEETQESEREQELAEKRAEWARKEEEFKKQLEERAEARRAEKKAARQAARAAKRAEPKAEAPQKPAETSKTSPEEKRARAKELEAEAAKLMQEAESLRQQAAEQERRLKQIEELKAKREAALRIIEEAAKSIEVWNRALKELEDEGSEGTGETEQGAGSSESGENQGNSGAAGCEGAESSESSEAASCMSQPKRNPWPTWMSPELIEARERGFLTVTAYEDAKKSWAQKKQSEMHARMEKLREMAATAPWRDPKVKKLTRAQREAKEQAEYFEYYERLEQEFNEEQEEIRVRGNPCELCEDMNQTNELAESYLNRMSEMEELEELMSQISSLGWKQMKIEVAPEVCFSSAEDEIFKAPKPTRSAVLVGTGVTRSARELVAAIKRARKMVGHYGARFYEAEEAGNERLSSRLLNNFKISLRLLKQAHMNYAELCR